jgi:hypothetical protein
LAELSNLQLRKPITNMRKGQGTLEILNHFSWGIELNRNRKIKEHKFEPGNLKNAPRLGLVLGIDCVLSKWAIGKLRPGAAKPAKQYFFRLFNQIDCYLIGFIIE